jgi:hypothetical protein
MNLPKFNNPFKKDKFELMVDGWVTELYGSQKDVNEFIRSSKLLIHAEVLFRDGLLFDNELSIIWDAYYISSRYLRFRKDITHIYGDSINIKILKNQQFYYKIK